MKSPIKSQTTQNERYHKNTIQHLALCATQILTITQYNSVILTQAHSTHRDLYISRKLFSSPCIKCQNGENIYTSTLPLTSTYDGLIGQRHDTTAKPLIKTRYSLYRRLDGPQYLSLLVRKITPTPAFDPLTFLPLAIRYSAEQ
jgi:hypothetical protein